MKLHLHLSENVFSVEKAMYLLFQKTCWIILEVFSLKRRCETWEIREHDGRLDDK